MKTIQESVVQIMSKYRAAKCKYVMEVVSTGVCLLIDGQESAGTPEISLSLSSQALPSYKMRAYLEAVTYATELATAVECVFNVAVDEAMAKHARDEAEYARSGNA